MNIPCAFYNAFFLLKCRPLLTYYFNFRRSGLSFNGLVMGEAILYTEISLQRILLFFVGAFASWGMAWFYCDQGKLSIYYVFLFWLILYKNIAARIINAIKHLISISIM